MKQFLLFCIFQLFLFSVIGQEKRLALVIGNANYNEATLDNPINDAILMKETFLKLGFEVVLFTDIETYSEFLSIIDNYNNKRKDYSVGFIYYAGHAVQIGGVNYMLATKEKYESESNIKYKGVNISIFTDEWENPYENELNVLILDACRNNPFEKKIYGDTRTIGKEGLGLAEIDGSKQPTGSIVAFSTAAGKTASDGKEGSKNSLYCQSLSTNLQLEDVSIRNIFGKVSKEIYIATNQYPVVSDKMFDVDFYLKKSTYIDQIIEIDSLIENDNFDFANEKTLIVLGKSPNNKATLLRKGRIEYLTKNSDYNGSHLFKADSLYPNDPEVHEYLGRYYSTIGEVEKGIKYMNRAIDLDSQDPELFYWRARFFEENNEFQNAESDYTQLIMLDSTVNRFVARSEFFFRCKEYELALQDYTKVIALDKENPKSYDNRADCYIAMNENTSALKDLDKAIDLAPDDAYFYNNRADFYKDYKTEYKLALKDYETALDISTDAYETIRALNNRALIFEYQEKFDLALEEYNKAIDKSPEDPLIYSNRANIYKIQEKYELALQDYTKVIALDKENPKSYDNRADCYIAMNENTSALKDLDKAIDLAPDDAYYYNNRADFYKDYKTEYELALKDYETALDISTDAYETIRTLNNRALIFEYQEKFDLALEEYNKAIDKSPEEPLIYSNRANIYKIQEKYELALIDYTKVIALDKENPESYYARAECYIAMNENTAALKDLDKAIDLAPKNPKCYNNRADFYKDYKTEYKLALKDYETALDISTDAYETIRALNNRALIFEYQEKFDLALEEYNKAIDKSPEEPLIYSNRANIYKIQEKYELALIDYTKVIALDKENPESYYARAECYIAMNENTAALKDLDKAIDLAPKNPKCYNNRADFYMKTEYDLALKDYETALDISTDAYETIRALNNRALIFQYQEKFDLALEEYNKAIDKSPEEPLIYSNRANIYKIQEKYELALQDYTKVIALDKENPESYDNRADCYIAMNENTSALKDLDKAIDLAPDDAYYYNNRADFYKDYKTEYKLALKDYETALDISTDAYETIRALNNRASIFEYQEKFDLALEEYNKAIDKSPEEPLIYSNRANIYKIQEKYELALQDYTQAIVLEPTNPNGYADRASFYKDELKRPYDALVDYSLAISIDSGVVYNWFMRGLLFSNELKDHKSAIRDFQNILKLDSNDVSVLNWLGVFYGRLGEDSLELEFYNRTIQKDGVVLGDTAEFYSSLGWAYNNLAYAFQKQNNNLQSLKYYNRAVELDPTEVLRYYERAWFHALYINNYDAAIQDINCALKMDERNPYWHLQRAKINLLANNSKDAKKDFVKAAEMSNDSEVYKVELANYFSIIGDNKNAEKNFINVLDNESLNSHYLHIKTSHLMRIKLWAEATENALKAIKMNEKDTMSYFQLGSIYLSTNQYQKALNAFLKAENIILLNDQQKEIDESDESQIFLSDIQYEILNLYLLLNESELACSYFNKAISTLEIETRSKKELINKKFKQKGIICQN